MSFTVPPNASSSAPSAALSPAENHLAGLLDLLEAHAVGSGPSAPSEQRADVADSNPSNFEALIEHLPDAFLSALDSAGPGLVVASLDRLDGLLKSDLRTTNPTLYGLCLGLRAQLSAASGRPGTEWDRVAEASAEQPAKHSADVGEPQPRPLSISISELFRWAGYRVEPMPNPEAPGDDGSANDRSTDDSASDVELLKVTHNAGPLAIRAVVSCSGVGDLHGVPSEGTDTDGDGNDDRWYPLFSIGDGVAMGPTGEEYVVKSVEVEQTLLESPGECGSLDLSGVASLELPTQDDWTAPAIGDQPAVDDAPAVVNGEVLGED